MPALNLVNAKAEKALFSLRLSSSTFSIRSASHRHSAPLLSIPLALSYTIPLSLASSYFIAFRIDNLWGQCQSRKLSISSSSIHFIAFFHLHSFQHTHDHLRRSPIHLSVHPQYSATTSFISCLHDLVSARHFVDDRLTCQSPSHILWQQLSHSRASNLVLCLTRALEEAFA